MNDQEIYELFQPLWGDFGDYQWMLDNRPLLAHYTSMHALEQIMKNEEIWFSNPLFMNDLEEMRFGINMGARLFEQNGEVDRAGGTPERTNILKQAFSYYYSQFDSHAINVFVFCLSQHDPKDTDGVLSMWRGYGRHGDGAALIFSTNLVIQKLDAPLIVARVSYASTEQRVTWLNTRLAQWCKIVAGSSIPDDKLHIAVYQIFNMIKLYALTAKHHGFREEREWRIIYMPDRDPTGILKDRFGYTIGRQGVEPKLKLKIEPLPIEPREQWTFESILDRIILGPSISSPLACSSVGRMLESMGKSEFCKKVFPSTIPLRPM
jgi:hypothetical protein